MFVPPEHDFFSICMKWIIISRSINEAKSFLKPLKLSINTDMKIFISDSEIYDVYKIHTSGALIVNRLTALPEKINRDNYGGIKLNVSFALVGIELEENKPFEIWGDKFYYPNTTAHSRSLINLFLHFGNMHNLTYNYKVTVGYGVKGDSGHGNWSGMIGQLAAGETEFSMQESRYRGDRLDMADCIITTRVHKSFYMIVLFPSFGSYTALVDPFDWITWISLICIVFVFIITQKIICFFLHLSKQWAEIIMFSIGALTQQGEEEDLRGVSVSLAVLVFLFLSFIVLVYYSGAVLNGLLTPSVTPLTTLAELLDNNFKVGVWDIVFNRDFHGPYSAYGPKTPTRDRLYSQFEKSGRIFYSLEDGIDRVGHGKFAYLTDNAFIYNVVNSRLSLSQICNIYEIDNFGRFHLGIYTTNGSPYKEHIKLAFSWMQETGIWKRWQPIWFEPKPPCLAPPEAKSIYLLSVSSAYLILLIGMMLSMFFFIINQFKCK